MPKRCGGILACILTLVVTLSACGESAPGNTPTTPPTAIQASPTAIPTQARVAEATQAMTPTAPLATATATATLIPPTIVPTSPPMPRTVTSDYTSTYIPFFAQKSRTIISEPTVRDVTGDGIAEYFYASYEGNCESCPLRQWITVFSGQGVIFDDNDYLLPSITTAPDALGFTITEAVPQGAETDYTASGLRDWVFRYNGSRFTFISKREYLNPAIYTALPTAIPPPASGSVQNYPTATPNRVGADTRTGIYMAQNWQWRGMPMPANVYYTGENTGAVGFYVDATEDAIFNWAVINWSKVGYIRRTGSRTDFCRSTNTNKSSTDCFILNIHLASQEPPNSISPYPGFTLVVVVDGRH